MADTSIVVVDVESGAHRKIKLVDNSDGTYSIASTAVISSADVQVDTDDLEALVQSLIDQGVPATPGYNADVNESEDAIKASAGTLFMVLAHNAHATDTRYLKLYDDTVANVTVGTTVPKIVIPIKAGQQGGFVIDRGVAFANAITIAATTDLLEDGSPGAPGANEVVCSYVFA